MSGDKIASLIALVACLFLATRAFNARSAQLPLQSKALMAAAWVLIIAVVAFVMGRIAR